MLPIRSILSTSLLLVAFVPYAVGQSPDQNKQDAGDVGDLETFQKLLDQVDPPSLHEALHTISPKKYKHGAFPEDRTAVEVIHREEPSVATSIVNLARRQINEAADLSKRQAGGDISNGTTPSSSPAGVTPESSTRPTPVPPISESGTLSEGASSTPADVSSPTGAPSVSTSSVAVPVSSSSTAPSTSAVPVSSSITSSEATSTPSSTRNGVSLTAGEVISTTNGVGLTIISTVGGGATTISPSSKGVTSTDTHKAAGQTSVVVQTSTLPNGSKSVVTAVTVVGAGASGAADTPSGEAGAGSGSPTSSSSPGLQTGEAVMTRGWKKEMVLVVGGAVAFAGML